MHSWSLCLVRVRRGSKTLSLNNELLWFGESLGLFSPRDKNKSCYRIFVELLKSKQGLSSDDLAFKLKISRSTTIHHIKKLIGSGIVVKEGGKYFLRVSSLSEMVDEISDDLSKILKDLKKSAERIDKNLNN